MELSQLRMSLASRYWACSKAGGTCRAPATDTITSLITGHFALGGTPFNINIVDAQQVLASHQDPFRCPDLVVRVTGFTAYFASISPKFRQLVIDRLIRGC